MRRWLAQQLAPISQAKSFVLKGSARFSPAGVSADLARLRSELSRDINRTLHVAAVSTALAEPTTHGTVTTYSTHFEVPHLQPLDIEPIPGAAILEQPLISIGTVSCDLFVPIPIPRISGKNYPLSNFEASPSQRNLFSGANDEAGHRGRAGFRKAYHQSATNGRATVQPLSLWDLLLPLLKPPINLDEQDALGFPDELYRFQVDGVKRLIGHKSFLLGDEMGTGKTVMTAVALRILFHQGKIRRALIVCPKSVLGVWDNHLRDWASTLSVTIINGSADSRRIDWQYPAHVYVASYETLRNDASRQEHATKSLLDRAGAGYFDAIVTDEAHAIKNATSGRAKAIVRLAALGKCKYRWALTGTPIQNSLNDLCGIFAFVKPGLFRKNEDVAPSNARRIIEPFFLRRSKRDVFPELPPKLREDVFLDLNDDQRAEYDAILERGRNEFQSGVKEFTRPHVFALLQKLKEVCNFASNHAESPKTEALLDQLHEVVRNGNKALVFSQYKRFGTERIAPLVRRFGAVVVTGDSSDSQVRDALERSQGDPATRVFLATVHKMGVGVTLTAASFVVHFDHWWNPAVAWQAEDRAHRKGQTETVNVYSYWMNGTIEDRIRAILDRKGLLHEEVINSLSESDFNDALTIDDLLQVLDLDRTSVRFPEKHAGPSRPTGLGSVLSRLSEIPPPRFEEVVMQVFKEVLDYPNARVTGRASDGGVDIEASKIVSDRLERIVVQCKRTKTVGPSVARELLGTVAADQRLHKGFLVTSGRLTRACRDFCGKQPRLEGVDGLQLARWIVEKGLAIPDVTDEPNDD